MFGLKTHIRMVALQGFGYKGTWCSEIINILDFFFR